MTKFTAILAAAILAISFAPAATAVCNDGEIALGHTVHVSHALLPSIIIIPDDGGEQDEYWIYANGCNYISNRGHYGGVCGNYGSSIVYCNSQ